MPDRPSYRCDSPTCICNAWWPSADPPSCRCAERLGLEGHALLWATIVGPAAVIPIWPLVAIGALGFGLNALRWWRAQ